VKVALAGTISTAVAQAMGLPVPWFATISAVVALEITMRVSLRTARNSVIGALVGAVLGLGLATIAKDQVWAVGVAVLVSFVVFGLARLDAVAKQSALVASVIVLIPTRTDLTTPEFAGIRLLETLIGIGVALAVNAAILPPRAFRGARRNLGESYQALAELYRAVVAVEATGVTDTDRLNAARRAFRTSIRQVDDLWDEALAERPAPHELAPHWRATTRRIWEQCAAMADVALDDVARRRLEPVREQLGALTEATADALDRVGDVLTRSDEEPLPELPELLALRDEVLDAVRVLELHDLTARDPADEGDLGSDLSFSHALQVFTFVNAVTMVALRLGELSVADPAASD
jgi:uncharacterized membrane protein YccC